jgi:hypothetical protein
VAQLVAFLLQFLAILFKIPHLLAIIISPLLIFYEILLASIPLMPQLYRTPKLKRQAHQSKLLFPLLLEPSTFH